VNFYRGQAGRHRLRHIETGTSCPSTSWGCIPWSFIIANFVDILLNLKLNIYCQYTSEHIVGTGRYTDPRDPRPLDASKLHKSYTNQLGQWANRRQVPAKGEAMRLHKHDVRDHELDYASRISVSLRGPDTAPTSSAS